MRLALAALLATLALVGGAAAQTTARQSGGDQPPRFVTMPGQSPAWIDALPSGFLPMVLPVRLDGMRVNAVIDTGAPFSLIDRGYARELGLPIRAGAKGISPNPASELPSTSILSLGFGDAERSGGRLYVTNLSGFQAFGLDVQLILGSDFLSCCALELDYEKGRARLLRSGARPVKGMDAPIRFSRDKDYFFTTLTVGGKPIDSIMIDTGGDGRLMLSEEHWTAAGLPAPPTSRRLLTVSGPLVVGFAQLAELMLGDASLREVGTTIQPTGEGALGGTHANGKIGAGLLQRYHVVIDVGAGRMTLAPRTAPLAPDRKDTSGIQGAPDGDAQLIFHVARNSPAERAGLKTGDRICRINGKPAAEAPRGWSMANAGETLELTLCDQRTIAVMLAEFY